MRPQCGLARSSFTTFEMLAYYTRHDGNAGLKKDFAPTQSHVDSLVKTYRYTAAWFSCREPNLVQILLASSSIEPMAEPSFPPLGPLVEDV